VWSGKLKKHSKNNKKVDKMVCLKNKLGWKQNESK